MWLRSTCVRLGHLRLDEVQNVLYNRRHLQLLPLSCHVRQDGRMASFLSLGQHICTTVLTRLDATVMPAVTSRGLIVLRAGGAISKPVQLPHQPRQCLAPTLTVTKYAVCTLLGDTRRHIQHITPQKRKTTPRLHHVIQNARQTSLGRQPVY